MGLGSLSYPLGAGSKIRKQYRQGTVSTLGDAFPVSDETPIREIEINALANIFHDIGEQAKRSQNETIPTLSSQTLDLWAYRLGVPVLPDEPDSEIRSGCSGKFRAQLGPTGGVIIDAIQAALGNNLGEVVFFDGYTAEQWTFWAGVNPSDVTQDLGTDAVGQWLSIRSHLLVVVKPIPGKTLAGTANLVEQALFPILDPLLPAYADWDFEVTTDPYEEGFTLDDDLLSYDGF